MSLTQRAARRLPTEPTVIELDVSSRPTSALAGSVGGQLDGVLHAIGFAPESCLGGGFLTAPWEDVAVALQVSAYSLKALAVACRPMVEAGGSIVGLDFDNTVAWPVYDWMGVAKAALEATARYPLERDLRPTHPHQPRPRPDLGPLRAVRDPSSTSWPPGPVPNDRRLARISSRHHRRDAPRRRRLPRHWCVIRRSECVQPRQRGTSAGEDRREVNASRMKPPTIKRRESGGRYRVTGWSLARRWNADASSSQRGIGGQCAEAGGDDPKNESHRSGDLDHRNRRRPQGSGDTQVIR